jgi:hypothetical protein
VCACLAATRERAEAPARAAGGYPRLCDVFLLAKKGSALLEGRNAHASRLHAAILLLAAQLAGMPRGADARTRRLTQWMQQREDLPEILRAHSQAVDAWFTADNRILASLAAAVRGATLFGVLARVTSAGVIALYLPFMC